MTRFFDTHAHYTDPAFEEDREALLAGFSETGIRVMLPGCNLPDARAAVSLAGRFSCAWAAVGIHPHDAAEAPPEALSGLETLLEAPKVKAVGEVGLDYHYEGTDRAAQKRVLYAQMALARERNLPVIFHDREAHEDALRAVRDFPGVRGVFHCFAGGVEMARTLIRMGWLVSLTGVVTFPNSKRAREVAARVPLESLMLETDAPYMAPVPHRGTRCDSRYVPLMAAEVARVRGISAEEVLERTYETACSFFDIQ